MKQKKYNKYILIFLIIFINAIWIIKIFDKKTTPKVLKNTKHDINEKVYSILNEDINNYLGFNNNVINNMVDITKNNKDEIIMVDYNLNNVYKMSNDVNEIVDRKLKESMKKNNIDFIYFGQIFDSSFFSYYGPKIPYKYDYIGNNISRIKTKVTEYGLNNVLLEMYLNLTINIQIITPIRDDELSTTFELLLNSKVINGRVPQIYGTSFERKTDLISTLNE